VTVLPYGHSEPNCQQRIPLARVVKPVEVCCNALLPFLDTSQQNKILLTTLVSGLRLRSLGHQRLSPIAQAPQHHPHLACRVRIQVSEVGCQVLSLAINLSEEFLDSGDVTLDCAIIRCPPLYFSLDDAPVH
jgi:hypothetical protein